MSLTDTCETANASLLHSLTVYYFAVPLQRFHPESFVIECDNLNNNDGELISL